jgi:hypothetical protein
MFFLAIVLFPPPRKFANSDPDFFVRDEMPSPEGGWDGGKTDTPPVSRWV